MNRYATIADLRLRVPTANALPTGFYPGTVVAWTQLQWDAATQAALDDAESMIDDCAFATKTLAAHVQYAAHLLSIRFPTSALSPGGAVGMVTSMSAGEISASFATPAVGTTDLSLTSFGREFERIAASVCATPTAVM